MPKNNITEYDSTAANNTDVGGVDLGENSMNPSDVNNALREIMSHLKDVDSGTQALTSLSVTGSATASTSLKTPLIEYTDGDDALTIADGGHVTANANFTTTGNLTASADCTVNGSFTSRGIDDNADATAITIDSSENVTLGSGKELRFVDTNESIKSDGSKLIIKSGGTTFNLPTSDGTSGQALTTNASGTLSFSSVGSSTTYSAVGTYVFANVVLSSGSVNPGGTSIAASNIRATNMGFKNLHTLSGGTWRVMGSLQAGAAADRTSIFVRVS